MLSLFNKVLFPLLDKVRQLSDSASTDKVDQGGNILIHHSRNTQQKQWAETQVRLLAICFIPLCMYGHMYT